MNPDIIESIGDELYAALTERRTIEPLTTTHADITIEDAYQISLRLLANRSRGTCGLAGLSICWSGLVSSTTNFKKNQLFIANNVTWNFSTVRTSKITCSDTLTAPNY